ncbi:Hypothetical protein MVR_LOCUS383 [uncultured virus]|nr:Hypothetical protein MVR_LOCUS383 [uncultured virus]
MGTPYSRYSTTHYPIQHAIPNEPITTKAVYVISTSRSVGKGTIIDKLTNGKGSIDVNYRGTNYNLVFEKVTLSIDQVTAVHKDHGFNPLMILYVYDVTDEVSFIDLQVAASLMSRNRFMCTYDLFVANKCDLANRVLATEQGTELAKTHKRSYNNGSKYIETSAAHDHLSISNLLQAIMNTLHYSDFDNNYYFPSSKEMLLGLLTFDRYKVNVPE